MRSVADQLRAETIRDFALLPPAERLRVAHELGERDLVAYATNHELTRKEALLVLQRQRKHGRRRSRCVELLA